MSLHLHMTVEASLQLAFNLDSVIDIIGSMTTTDFLKICGGIERLAKAWNHITAKQYK